MPAANVPRPGLRAGGDGGPGTAGGAGGGLAGWVP